MIFLKNNIRKMSLFLTPVILIELVSVWTPSNISILSSVQMEVSDSRIVIWCRRLYSKLKISTWEVEGSIIPPLQLFDKLELVSPVKLSSKRSFLYQLFSFL